MNEYNKQYLLSLVAVANQACRAAYANRKTLQDAVNWGDLSCIESKWTINSDGHSFYSVVIEEVSPNADKFRAFIDQFLEVKGYRHVVIELEW